MGYQHISNLYKDVRILEFKKVYCLEKLHGTSSHISFHLPTSGGDNPLRFFSGGEKYENFVKLFDQEALLKKFQDSGVESATVYGEAYGGKQQGMKDTYGPNLKFIAFEVQIGDSWLSVPQAEAFVKDLGLEFVYWELVSSDMDSLNAQRDADSVQAIRNGMGPGHKREGVVLRPPFECTLNNGERLIAKHKRDDFRETKTPRVVGVPLEVMQDAQKVADEFVTELRLSHVIDKLPEATGIEHTGLVVKAMVEDVFREGAGEFEETPQLKKCISQAAAKLWKKRVSRI